MPFSMKLTDIEDQLDKFSSILIVVCHVCPRMIIAADNGQPYFSLKNLITGKDFFSAYIKGIQEVFAQKKRCDIFNSLFPAPMMCLWSGSQRSRLKNCIPMYDAVAVLGCESAIATVADSAEGYKGSVVQIMSVEGIANLILKIRFPLSIYLLPSKTSIVPVPQNPVK